MNLFLRGVVSRGRYQFGLALVLAVVIPTLVRVQNFSLSGDPASWVNTIVIATVTLTVAFFIWRQLNRLPSVTGLLYVFWSLMPVYAVALLIITMTRLDYSRFLLMTSFLIAVGWFMFIQYAQNKLSRNVFLIIPGGNVEKLTLSSRIEWKELEKPFGFPGKGKPIASVSRQGGIDANTATANFVKANGIVADLRHSHGVNWERFIAEATLNGIPVYHYKQLEERLSGRVSIEHLSENSFGSILPDSSYLKMKQVMDVMFTLMILPVLLPLMLIIAALIRIKEGGPVMFVQPRMGYRGEPFIAYKFRTMRHEDNSKNKAKGDVSWAMTSENDPRITPFGHFLRRSRLDELPQAINILKGEMSWIGPRPEVVELSDIYESQIPFYVYRHAVRPGISGWAQVNQGHVTSVNDISEKLRLDFFYIKNISLLLDFVIVLKTVRTMLRGTGAK